jgi:putative spermidine/putrescine transport system ATP-binding protein
MTKQSLPVRIEAVSKRFGTFEALRNVHLDVKSGEFLTLLGPSGSGKTTLLMVLAGFVRPDAGHVLFGDKDVVRLPPHKRNIGMVFQNYALFPHMTVAQNVAYPLRIRNVSKLQREEKVKQILEMVQLDQFANRDIGKLSGGQRQRVALARAIVFEPGILLMDEPLSALDKNLRETMQIEIKRLHDQLGMTTISVTHDQREALTMSDRIAVINDGEMVQVSTPQSLFERPKNYFVAEFIGETAFLPVKVEPDGKCFFHNKKLLKIGAKLRSNVDQQWLVVRSEKLRLLNHQDNSDPYNCIEGTLQEIVYQGESQLMNIVTENGEEILIRQSTRRDNLPGNLTAGSTIKFGLHPDDTVIVPK